jgi:crossover junction endodeoxyribonuclease RuvC
MRVIGLDMSTCSGVAIVDSAKGVIHAEDVTYPKLKGYERINAICARVLELRDTHQADCAVIEDYFMSKFGGASIISIEIANILRFLLWQEGFPFVAVTASQLKKFLTGSGTSKKDQITLEVYKRYGYSATSNDIADAVALGYFGQTITDSNPKAIAHQLKISAEVATANPGFILRAHERCINRKAMCK